ncbi:hypothetical protein [Nitrosopumilus sp.]|uniref:hypothetical protein n=1 Tax=Nitrosopumilus sp. TaxID=2024843 RepID=UPI00349FF11D
MPVENKQERTSVFSIRIKDSVKEKLEAESKIQKVNSCTLINQIIVKYLDWDRFGKDIGSVCVTKKYLRAILSDQDKTQVIHIAKFVSAPSFKDIILFMHNKVTYQSILTTIKDWLERSHFQFRFVDDGTDSFIIQHEMGDKWPLHFLNMITPLFVEVAYDVNEIDFNETNLCFKIVKLEIANLQK